MIGWGPTLTVQLSTNAAAKEIEDRQNLLKYEMDCDNHIKRRDACKENKYEA